MTSDLPITGFLILLIGVNVIVFSMFGYDKRQARRNGWRIPEKTLLIFSLTGPFGAFAGMRTFHHKTQKMKFYILIPLFIVIQVAGGIFLIKGTL